MKWHYQLIQHEEHVELVEVYYEDDGSIFGYTDALLTAQDKDDMQKTLALMHHDVMTKPVLQASELPRSDQ